MWFSKAVVLFFCFSSFTGIAQKPFRLSFTNQDYKGFKRNPENSFKDSLGPILYAQKFKFSAIEKGYLTASIDSAYFVEKKYYVDFHLGPKFGDISLNMTSEDFNFFRKHMKISEKFLTNQKFRPAEVAKLMRDLHNCLLSNGYPFAKISMKNIEVSELSTTAFLKIDKFNQLKWSKIIVKGDTAVSTSYLYNLLQIKPGNLYNETQLRFITDRINQVSFLTEIKPHEILYTPEGVELYVYINSKPLSSINGFLGLQPDPIKNKYFLTGELTLKLVNVLKRGELLDISWRNIQSQTQQLQAIQIVQA
jgi:hypothetical protein